MTSPLEIHLGRPRETSALVVKHQDVIYIYDVEPSESLLFEEDKNAAYNMSKQSIPQYCAVYTADYK